MSVLFISGLDVYPILLEVSSEVAGLTNPAIVIAVVVCLILALVFTATWCYRKRKRSGGKFYAFSLLSWLDIAILYNFSPAKFFAKGNMHAVVRDSSHLDFTILNLTGWRNKSTQFGL